MKFWKTLKAASKSIDPDNDWSKFETDYLVKVLKREEWVDACLKMHAGNRIVAELLDRFNKQLKEKP